MLSREDREAIEGLFDRLADAARQAPHRDGEAEALIAREMARHPAAAYYMAQTIVVQQQALEAAEQRIEQLEREAGERRRYADDSPQPRQRGPWDRPNEGGFLAGAMQTALGVAGGVLLGNAIASLFSVGDARAEDHSGGSHDDPSDDGHDDFDGGDIGGDGFDTGGDF